MNFAACSSALREHGLGWPKFIIDLARLDANVARLRRSVVDQQLRLVVKSLPCPDLLARLMGALGTQRLMVFHLPFLLQVVRHWPQADIMLGKPLPAAAVSAFYRAFDVSGPFDSARALHWLVDTPARVRAYVVIARRFGVRMNVVVELDVGMHRGGAGDSEALRAVLDAIAAGKGTLALSGFMGYDAHAAKGVPWLSRKRAVAQANAVYARLVEAARAMHPGLLPERLLCNGAGSPTCVFHGADSPLTELAIGSIFLKPAEFDLPQLASFEPACWLAAPVIKRLRGVRIPFLEAISRFSRRDTLFIYGGRWPVTPCWPDGLRDSSLYGPSFNQQFLTVPRRTTVGEDDFVFFRPLQSESVMPSLGDVLAIEPDGSLASWPVLEQKPPDAGPDANGS